MDSRKTKFNSIDEYIAACPAEYQGKLEELRAIIQAAAPGAQERISYGMPAFALNGVLVFFGFFTKHIGFYPIPSGIAAFEQELSVFKRGKGSIQFPLDQPLPLDLIARIVKFRIAENLKNAGLKAAKKK